MFDLIRHSVRFTSYESQVRMAADQICQNSNNPLFSCVSDLRDFKNALDYRIKDIKKENSIWPEFCFKTIIEDNSLKVWHLTADGELDRLICEIKQLNYDTK